jgi:hypothetical protein
MPVTTAGRSSNSAALRALADRRAYALAPLIAEMRENGGMHPVSTAPLVNRRFLALAARFRLSVRPR